MVGNADVINCVPFHSAKQKLDEDLEEMKTQIKLYSGEPTPGQEQRPSHAYMNTGMVS